MFNKKNNKTKTEGGYSELAKFHTMKDDILGESKNISEEEIDKTNGGYDTNSNSPFLGSANNNFKVEPDPKLPISSFAQEANNPLAQSRPQNVTNSYPHIPTPKESDSVESKNEEKMDFSQMDSEKKSSFGYVVIVIIILLLGAGGYYLWST